MGLQISKGLKKGVKLERAQEGRSTFHRNHQNYWFKRTSLTVPVPPVKALLK